MSSCKATNAKPRRVVDAAEGVLQRAARWVRKEMAKRDDGSRHPSFPMQEILLEAEEKFDLGTFGVEGWSTSVAGHSGVSYLNTGDSYGRTLVARTSTRGWRRWSVHVGCWAAYA